MKTYDIVSSSNGWLCAVDGVHGPSLPSWLLALNAVRSLVEKDRRRGVKAVIRYQGLNGDMLPLEIDGARHLTADASFSPMPRTPGYSHGLQSWEVQRLAGK